MSKTPFIATVPLAALIVKARTELLGNGRNRKVAYTHHSTEKTLALWIIWGLLRSGESRLPIIAHKIITEPNFIVFELFSVIPAL